MYREDGRTNSQCREVNIAMDGTGVTLRHGSTEVVTIIKHRHPLNKKRVTIEVVLEKSSHQKNVPDVRLERTKDELEAALGRVFSQVFLEPENTYYIVHQVSYANGSLLPILINSTSIALCKYAIPITYLIFGVTCGLSKKVRGACLVDLTDQEEREQLPTVVLAQPFIQHRRLVALLTIRNALPIEEHQLLISAAEKALGELSTQIRALLEQTPGTVQF